MENCPWNEIIGFRSSKEYNSCTEWLSEQIYKNIAIKVDVSALDPEDNEIWILHKPSKQIWRLIRYEGYPFTGHFIPKDKHFDCLWPEIKKETKISEYQTGFYNYEEFERFILWLEEQVTKGIAQEIKITEPFFTVDNIPQNEKWFLHIKSGTRWSLTWPDGPMSPSFIKIKE